ncbi:MAG: S-layer homology domain-containing protein [Halanaerobium sp.]|nr:S-layer homology domain-containing protein [Halanaerobium sp.]
MKKIALFLALVMVFAMAIPAFANPFSDVSTNHWAYDAIVKVLASGIMDGYPDGTFKGRNAVSRYEIAVALARILENAAAERDALEAELQAEIDANAADTNAKIEEIEVSLADIVKRMSSKGLNDEEASDVALMIRALTAGLKQEIKQVGLDLATAEKALGERIDALELRVEALEDPVFEWSASTALDIHDLDYTGYVDPYTSLPYVDPFALFEDSDDSGTYDADEGVVFDDDETFDLTLETALNIERENFSVDLTLNTITNILEWGYTDGSNYYFDAIDLAGTITTPEFTATMGDGIAAGITDYLFDTSDSSPLWDGVSGRSEIDGLTVDGVYGYYALTRDSAAWYFGSENTFDLAGQDVNVLFGVENPTGTGIDNTDWVLGANTTFGLGLFETTVELATNDKNFNGRLFRIDSTGTVDPIDLTFHYENISPAFAGVLGSVVPDSVGFDITGETEISVVDLALTYSDYVVAGVDDTVLTFTADVPAVDADDNDIRPEFNGIKYSAGFLYENVLHLTNATALEWNFEVEEDINIVNVVAGLDYGDYTTAYEGYASVSDFFDKYLNLSATLAPGLTGTADYNFDSSNSLTTHEYALDYEQGIFFAGMSKDMISTDLVFYAGVDPEPVTVAYGVDLDSYFEYNTNTTASTSYYTLQLDATKVVDNKLTVTGNFEYGDNDGYLANALSGRKLEWGLGAEYTIVEDVAATLSYTNLAFDGDTVTESYDVEEVAAGFSYDF